MSISEELENVVPAKLAVEQVSKRFRAGRGSEVHALDAVSLQVNVGGFVCVAFVDGGRDLRHDLDRLRAWSFAALWSRVKCNGPGYRRHARHRCHRSARGQNFVLALGTLSAQAMGRRTSLNR